jgi:hypothetical protein
MQWGKSHSDTPVQWWYADYDGVQKDGSSAILVLSFLCRYIVFSVVVHHPGLLTYLFEHQLSICEVYIP